MVRPLNQRLDESFMEGHRMLSAHSHNRLTFTLILMTLLLAVCGHHSIQAQTLPVTDDPLVLL